MVVAVSVVKRSVSGLSEGRRLDDGMFSSPSLLL